MNGFAALDNSPCLRYVVVKATAQNWGETRNKSFISIGGIKYGRVNYC